MHQGQGNEAWRESAFLGHTFSLVKIGVVLKHQVLREEPKRLGYSEGGDKERHGQNRVTGVTRQRSERKETAAGGVWERGSSQQEGDAGARVLGSSGWGASSWAVKAVTEVRNGKRVCTGQRESCFHWLQPPFSFR